MTVLRATDEFGPSTWMKVGQETIDAFAACTCDGERAEDGSLGTPAAHGFLILSLCIPLLYEVSPLGPDSSFLNYGVDRVRFPSPVPRGSSIRARFAVTSVQEQANGERVALRATVELKGQAQPACVADLVLLVSSTNGAAA